MLMSWTFSATNSSRNHTSMPASENVRTPTGFDDPNDNATDDKIQCKNKSLFQAMVYQYSNRIERRRIWNVGRKTSTKQLRDNLFSGEFYVIVKTNCDAMILPIG